MRGNEGEPMFLVAKRGNEFHPTRWLEPIESDSARPRDSWVGVMAS